MARRLTTSFDDLMRERYGAGNRPQPSGKANGKTNGHAGRATAVTRGADDGETLQQSRSASTARAYAQEYIVGEVVRDEPSRAAASKPNGAAPEERAPGRERTASPSPEGPAPAPPRSDSASPGDASAKQECRVDVAEPLKTPAAPEPARAQSIHGRDAPIDDQFIQDMQSILSGKTVFDPKMKKTVPKTTIDKTTHHGVTDPRAAAVLNAPAALPAPDGTGQAIFDRIAQSMQYANRYNAGEIALDNRFAEFDALAELEKSAKKKAAATSASPQRGSGLPPVASEEFVRDLDAIRRDQSGMGIVSPTVAPMSMPARALSLPAPSRYSRPFFDTGEHAQTAGDLYEGRLMVGRAPGVAFSYGQIIAMADLYESVDQMMSADPAELRRLKALIEQSTAHYTRRGPDVDDETWDTNSNERYLKLAEDNYEHFSPPLLVKGVRPATRRGDNKSAWEASHRRAIEAAQQQYLAQPNVSHFFEWPLIINGFGDHFLTDAFAAGHLVNKEVMIDAFKRNFLPNGSLTSAAESFFLKVALKSFRGDVAAKFSSLETANYPVCALGWCFKWHPNIDTPNMFAKLLTTAAEEQPDRVANLAVRALHDHLNKQGILVSNEAGDTPWMVKGDGYLDAANLTRIRKAVQQSVDNINDPAIFASNVNFDALFKRVWRYVPKLIEPSLSMVSNLMTLYTTPTDTLADAAAVIVHNKVDSLVKMLKKEGKLKAA